MAFRNDGLHGPSGAVIDSMADQSDTVDAVRVSEVLPIYCPRSESPSPEGRIQYGMTKRERMMGNGFRASMEVGCATPGAEVGWWTGNPSIYHDDEPLAEKSYVNVYERSGSVGYGPPHRSRETAMLMGGMPLYRIVVTRR